MKAKGPKYVTQLWSLRDDILTHIRSLEALGVSGKQCEIFLTPIILSRLPNEIRLEWARKGAGHESDLDWLLTFLREEIESLERSEAFKDVTAGKRESLSPPDEKKNWQTREPHKGKLSSAAALHTSSEGEKPLCGFCNKKHASERCFETQRLSGKERVERIKTAGMCFKCLGKGHIAKGCYARCQKCRGYHHHLICGVKIDFSKSEPVRSDSVKATQEPTSSSNGEASRNLATNLAGVSLSNISVHQETCTILQTAQVRVAGANGVLHMAKLLFDSGSSRT